MVAFQFSFTGVHGRHLKPVFPSHSIRTLTHFRGVDRHFRSGG